MTRQCWPCYLVDVEAACTAAPAPQRPSRQSPCHAVTLPPAAGIYDPSFIAANQAERADNVIKGSKAQQVRCGNMPKHCIAAPATSAG